MRPRQRKLPGKRGKRGRSIGCSQFPQRRCGNPPGWEHAVEPSGTFQIIHAEPAPKTRCQVGREPLNQFLAISRLGLAALLKFHNSPPDLPVSGGHERVDRAGGRADGHAYRTIFAGISRCPATRVRGSSPGMDERPHPDEARSRESLAPTATIVELVAGFVRAPVTSSAGRKGGHARRTISAGISRYPATSVRGSRPGRRGRSPPWRSALARTGRPHRDHRKTCSGVRKSPGDFMRYTRENAAPHAPPFGEPWRKMSFSGSPNSAG